MDKISEIKELVQELNKYCYEYYVLNNSSISDKEYDKKYDKLVKLEKETNCILSYSPTQRVGYEIQPKLEKINHPIALKSLDKTKDINILKKFLGNKDGVLMLKMDGLTGRVDYDKELILGATRGNGTEGELITHNVKTFKNIPIKLNEKISASGECIIAKDDFIKINENLSEENKYKTPRNLAAGSVRQLDSRICSKRNIKFYAFNMLQGKEFKYKDEELNFLEQLGFDTVPFKIVNNNNLEKSIEELKEFADRLYLPIDGLVLTYRDLEYGRSLGETSHHPLHSLAFKFYDEEIETTLRNIEWSIGRTGNITPVAIFDTVELDGTEVNRASVHNLSILKQLKLGIEDTITVYKANQIIPQIKDNFTRSNNIEIPNTCPECGGKTERKISEQAEFLICTNPNCKAKLVQKISHYCSKNAMNIIGLSEATIEKFIDKGFIKDITDIYKLEQYKNAIIVMEGFGLKSYNNLIKSIEDSKKCNLDNFIFALGIENVGKSTAKDLANYFKYINSFMYSAFQDYLQIKDIGNVTAYSLRLWIDNKQNRDVVNQLLQYIAFKIEEKKEVITNTDNPLYNKHIYCTGKFNLKKEELKEKLEKIGAIVESGYKKSLDYLICGGDMSKSGKADKAAKDGVQLMSEDQMMEFLNH